MSSGTEELFNMMAEQAKNAELNGNGMMVLGELYNQLLTYPRESVLVVEWADEFAFAGDLISYRGYYEDLSFDMSGKSTVGDTLDDIDDYLNGESYEGYKGREYYAHYNTLVWASEYATCSGHGVTGMFAVGDRVILTTVDTNDN